MRRHRDDRNVRIAAALFTADGSRRFKAVHSRHLHVHQHHIESVRGEQLQGLYTIPGDDDAVAMLLQDAADAYSTSAAT